MKKSFLPIIYLLTICLFISIIANLIKEKPNCTLGLATGSSPVGTYQNLIKAGSEHRKFMRQIFVSVDITAPLYWWKEFDTYKVGTVRNSCSTMHKIHEKPFDRCDFSFDKVLGGSNAFINHIISELNGYREMYVETKRKEYWYTLIQLLPSSYNQRATVQLNYAVLRNMYHSRKNHKLDEWSQGFTKWVESLPYSELITEGGEK